MSSIRRRSKVFTILREQLNQVEVIVGVRKGKLESENQRIVLDAIVST